MQNAFDALKERGFIQQVTDEAAVRAMFDDPKVPVIAYCGFDPTADSLHVGNFVPLKALMHLERLGHKPIFLLGGGTARVGDPSGKTEMRQMQTDERLDQNRAAIRTQVGRFFDFDKSTRFLDNADWLLGLNYVGFLRDIGRHFSVNRMLAAEAYKQRLERGLSFIEFNYQILQAYDYLELFRRHRCVLQIGGDDQWGNILAGVDLVRRIEGTTVHALTFPLLTTATGEKMGKTAAGALWLDAQKLAPYDFYQYFVNAHDADVEKMLGFFTFLPMSEVRAVKELPGAALNVAKSILAFEVTKIVHGEEEAKKAHVAAQAAFGGRAIDKTILPSSSVPREALASVESIPTIALTTSDLAALTLKDLLVGVTKLCKSGNEAMNKLKENAVSLEPGGVVSDPKLAITPASFKDGALLVRVGKKNVRRVTLA